MPINTGLLELMLCNCFSVHFTQNSYNTSLIVVCAQALHGGTLFLMPPPLTPVQGRRWGSLTDGEGTQEQAALLHHLEGGILAPPLCRCQGQCQSRGSGGWGMTSGSWILEQAWRLRRPNPAGFPFPSHYRALCRAVGASFRNVGFRAISGICWYITQEGQKGMVAAAYLLTSCIYTNMGL